MKDLQELINEKFEKIVNDGFVEKIVEEKLESCIQGVFSNCFSSYGAINKRFEKQIEEAVESKSFNLDLETYADTMRLLVQVSVAKHFKGAAQESLNASLDAMFQPVPAETTMQELVTMIAEAFKDDDYDNDRDEYMSVEFESSSHGWYTAQFWKKKENISSYSGRSSTPDIDLHISSDGEIRWLEGGKKNYGAHNYGVEAILYRMTIKRTKITDICDCDQDDFEDTYIGLGEEC